MKNVSRRGIFLVSLFMICTVAVLWRRFGASNTNNPEQQSVRDSLYQQKRVLLFNSKVYSKAVRLANDGDMVVRQGAGLTGELQRDVTLKDTAYNQAGIISREHDTVFVYYASDDALHPGQRLLREPLWNYGHPTRNKRLALYRVAMDSSSMKQLIAVIQKLYRQSVSIDTAFNLTTKNRLYNTAFVAYSFEKALRDTNLFRRLVVDSKHDISVNELISSSHTKKIASWSY